MNYFRPEAATDRAAQRIAPILLAVLVIAVAINAFSMLGSHLWVAPDTSYYAELAGGIADHGNFTSQLFLVRPPGYPLMLAGIFLLFGDNSATAILITQHAMVALTAVLIAAIAWELTRSRLAAALAGLMSAASLQLIAYANIVMTEAPFGFITALSVYFLICYFQRGHWRWLIAASAAAGFSYLFRPIGMTLVGACALAVLIRADQSREHRHGRDLGSRFPGLRHAAQTRAPRPALARLFTGGALALLPAFAVTAPAMIHNKMLHGGDLSARCADLALYFRVAYMDKLDSPNSAALADIKSVVAEAIDAGHLPPGSDHRLWGQVWKAYESVRGQGLAQASAIMGQAARDLIREHPLKTAKLTVKYSYWMLMVPDSFYRFHPGGAPATVTEEGVCLRQQEAEIFDAATYEPMMRRWTGPYEHYFKLSEVRPGPLTPQWTAINRWFYRHIERGPGLPGPIDSPYESFTWLCLICCAACCVFSRNRAGWMLIAAAIALQIGISAALAGPTPRYAVPLKPLLILFPAACAGSVLATALNMWRRIAHTNGMNERARNWAGAVD